MEVNYSKQYRARIGNFNREKKLGEETKNKLEQKALMRPPRVFSEQAKDIMKKRSKAVIVYNKNGTMHGEYSSIIDASLNLNCRAKTLKRALQSKSKVKNAEL